jgi:hypothetical protein
MAETISHRRSGILSSQFPTCPYSVSARLHEYRVVDVLDDYWKCEFVDEEARQEVRDGVLLFEVLGGDIRRWSMIPMCIRSKALSQVNDRYRSSG